MARHLFLAALIACAGSVVASDSPRANPAIDIAGHLRIAAEAAQHRETRRVTEGRFLEMSREPGAIVLDARSKEKYDELHVKGAMHLSYPDFSFESLATEIPDKATTILIYRAESRVGFVLVRVPESPLAAALPSLHCYSIESATAVAVARLPRPVPWAYGPAKASRVCAYPAACAGARVRGASIGFLHEVTFALPRSVSQPEGCDNAYSRTSANAAVSTRTGASAIATSAGSEWPSYSPARAAPARPSPPRCHPDAFPRRYSLVRLQRRQTGHASRRRHAQSDHLGQ